MYMKTKHNLRQKVPPIDIQIDEDVISVYISMNITTS